MEELAFQCSQPYPALRSTLFPWLCWMGRYTVPHPQECPLHQESQDLSPLPHPLPSGVIPPFPLYFTIGSTEFRWRRPPRGMAETSRVLRAEMKGSAAERMRSQYKCQLLSSGKPKITHSHTQSFICYGASRGCLLEMLPCP